MARNDVTDLLYEGESVERSISVGAGEVVVTGRRVLAFSPDTPGKNYRHVERPNVTGARVRTVGSAGYLKWVGGAVVLAVGFVVVGRLLDFGGMFGSLSTGPGASATGTGGIIGSMQSLGETLALIDDVLIGLGVFCLLVAGLAGALYVRSRRRVLTIEVAGDEDIELSATELPDAGDDAAEIRSVLDLEPGGEDGPAWRR